MISIRPSLRPARLAMSLLVSTSLLAGCAPGQFSTQAGRIGPDDGTDACRPQLVALDSTGNYFTADILTGAALGALGGAAIGGLATGNWRGALIGAAAGGALGAAGGYWSAVQQQRRDQAGMYAQVQGDLTNENAQIDKTLLAFNQLQDCRYRQAQQVRADYAAGRIDRTVAQARMNGLRAQAMNDLAIARRINDQIQGRAQQFDVAAENLSPGAQAQIQARAPAARPATVRRQVAMKLNPETNGPQLGTLKAKDQVTVTGTEKGYAVVQTASGERGYVPLTELQGPGAAPPPPPPPVAAGGNSQEVATLAGSNAARRDAFAQRVSVSESAAAKGFELAG